MAINLIAVTVRHERRVRLSFDNSLAGAAFASTSFYSVTDLTGGAANPGVVKALVVANSPHTVELQLNTDLVQGGRYRFFANAVPAIDSSVTPTPSSVDASIGAEPAQAALGAHGPVTDLERELYGVDLLRDGADFTETPDGDLALVGGIRCATIDVTEAMTSNGLPWDPSYGLQARSEVDGNPRGILNLRGRAIRILRADDRVADAKATVDLTDPSAPVLSVQPTFIGARGTPAVPIRPTFVTDR